MLKRTRALELPGRPMQPSVEERPSPATESDRGSRPVMKIHTLPLPRRGRGALAALLTVLPTLLAAVPAQAQREPAVPPSQPGENPTKEPSGEAKADRPYELGLQSTVILQHAFRFHSPYQGANSFRSHNETELSDTYTLYLGWRPARNVELYLNPEMARGQGLSQALGIAGYVNGDVIRNPALGQEPYLARYFARWTVPLHGGGTEKIEPGENKIGGTAPAHRLVFTAGKLGTNDLFDLNRYANSTRTQFLNWALINGAAYDYAADTRGYSQGAAVEWVHPKWVLRLGSFQMPRIANGPELATNLGTSRGDQVELELRPKLLRGKGEPAVIRLLGYRNLAHMGRYRDALNQAHGTGRPPDITAVERSGAEKLGFGINVEQPLADDGETGLFGRLTWNDDQTESFAFTEAGGSLSLGGQLSGARWGRPKDRLGVAVVQSGLSRAHRAYLAAGGVGFILGDGRLSYGPEQILEAYYSHQLNKYFSVSADYQVINHPGFNRDRGPVSVIGLRLHLEY